MGLRAAKDGLEVRLEMAKAIVSGHPEALTFQNRKLSLARDAFLKRYYSEVDGTLSSFLDLQIVALIHAAGSLDEAVQAHDALIDIAENKYLGALALGLSSSARIPDIEDIPSNLDRSLYLQSSALVRSKGGESIAPHFREFVRDCYNVFGIGYPLQTFRELEKLGGHFGAAVSLRTLSDVASLAPILVQNAWFVLGTEIRLAIDGMCEGRGKDPVVAAAIELYGLSKLADRIARVADAARLSAPSDSDQKNGFDDIAFAQLARAQPTSPFASIDEGFFGVAGGLLMAVAASLQQGKIERSYRCLSLLYELDPFVLRLLDWARLDEALPSFRDSPTVAKCFADVLFADTKLTELDPSYDPLSRGEGVFIGSFSRIIEARRAAKRTLFALVAEIKDELTPRAATKFADFWLAADIADNFHMKLPTPAIMDESLEDELSRTEYLRAAQRIQVAQQFKRQRLLDATQCDAVIEEERKCISMVRFRKVLDRGRIRIPRGMIRGETLRFVSEITPRIEFNRRHGDVRDAKFIASVLPLFRNEIEKFVFGIFLAGVDKLISANIRHGMIKDRYQASFLSTVRDVYAPKKRAFNWEDPLVTRAIGPMLEDVSELRKEISLEVDQFTAEDLTLRVDTDEIQLALDDVTNEVGFFLAAAESPNEKLIEVLISKTKARVSSVLEKMRARYDALLAIRVNSLVSSCRARVEAKIGNEFLSFFETLAMKLKESHREISNWLRVTDDKVEFSVFSAKDLVVLEADVVHLSGSHGIDFKTACMRRADGKLAECKDIQVHGAYFPMLSEIVHNLMSNAIRHSGQKYETHIRMSFTCDGEDFIVACRNSIVPENLRSFLLRHSELVALAGADDDSVSGREGNSGFKKINESCRQHLGQKPKINIPRPRSTAKQIAIEVRLPVPASMIVGFE